MFTQLLAAYLILRDWSLLPDFLFFTYIVIGLLYIFFIRPVVRWWRE